MRRPFASLALLYIRSVYGLRFGTAGSGPAGYGAVAYGAAVSGARLSVKQIAKTLGFTLLAVLLAADIILVFAMNDIALYRALRPQGLQGMLFLNSAIRAALLVFVLGFATALSTFSLSAAESSLLALPIKPRHLLGAKFLMVYLSEFLFSLVVLGSSAVVYGVGEAAPPAFYLAALLIALSAPLLPLAAAYLIIVPLMSAVRAFRNKNALMVIGGAVGLGFALLFNLYVQSATARASDPAWLLESYAGPDSLLARIGAAYPPSLFAWRSLARAASPDGWASGLAYGLGALALGLFAALAAVLLLAAPYARSLADFGEEQLKKLARGRSGAFIDRAFRRRGALASLLAREWKLMNREPRFFLNGPFTVIFGPLILGIMYFAQRESFDPMIATLDPGGPKPYALLAVAALAAFLGSATSITCTALSRDAKHLAYLKALPLDPAAYMGAKFLHGFLVSVAGCLVGVLAGGAVVRIPPRDGAAAFFIALAFSALIDLAGLWLDTANPRLRWDNPMAALKQNPNAGILVVGTMALLGGLGYLASVLPLGKAGATALFGGGSLLLFAAAWLPYPAYARRRIAALEP